MINKMSYKSMSKAKTKIRSQFLHAEMRYKIYNNLFIQAKNQKS